MAISDSGTLVYIPGGMGATTMGTLVWVDRDGREEPIDEVPRAYNVQKISPDGTKVALTITEDGNEDIWIYDLARKTPTLLTRQADVSDPIWTHDSKHIIWGSRRKGRVSIFSIAADGTGETEQILQIDNTYFWPVSLSKDEKTLFFGQWNESGMYNIGMIPMEGEDHTPKLLLHEEYNESSPQISPQGDWLAYMTDQSDQLEVYIHSFPDMDSGRKEKVSTDGGLFPLWSPPDGKELFYVNPSGELMVVTVETDPELILGNPQRLFDIQQYLGWDIDPEGKRFLMIKGVEEAEDESAQGKPRKIVVVTNWFEELKETAPVD